MFKLALISVFIGLSVSTDYGSIELPVKSSHELKVIRLPSIQEEHVTHVDVPGSVMPVYMLFKSLSSPLYVKQVHKGTKGSYQKTASKDEPHQLLHQVLKPVVQELMEVITPYRKVVQVIEPVKEERLTTVHKGQRKTGLEQEGLGYGKQIGLIGGIGNGKLNEGLIGLGKGGGLIGGLGYGKIGGGLGGLGGYGKQVGLIGDLGYGKIGGGQVGLGGYGRQIGLIGGLGYGKMGEDLIGLGKSGGSIGDIGYGKLVSGVSGIGIGKMIDDSSLNIGLSEGIGLKGVEQGYDGALEGLKY